MKLLSFVKILKCSVWLILVLVAFHTVYYFEIDLFRQRIGKNSVATYANKGETKLKQKPSPTYTVKVSDNEVNLQDSQNEEAKETNAQSNTKSFSITSTNDALKQQRVKESFPKKVVHRTGSSQSETGSSGSSESNKEMNAKRTGRNLSEASTSSQMKSKTSGEYDATSYDGHDLLKDPKFTFDKRFKNPCWYDGDELKCLPYFFVIGVKKCGTSTVFGTACQFPDVMKPGFKEAQFFARRRFARGYDDIELYIERFAQVAKTLDNEARTTYFGSNKTIPFITGEGSPSNLHLNSHWMNLPGNENLTEPKYVILDYIKHFLPDAKIIITFRDPIERLYSDYYHEYGTVRQWKNLNPEHFHEIVVNGTEMYRECFSKRTIRSCVYDPTFYDITKIQIQLGIYFIFWQELLRVFPREQILVLQNKNLSSTDTNSKIQKFLGLDPLPDEEQERVKFAYQRRPKYRRKGPMLNETIELLYSFYRPFNEKMAALTQDETFLYSHDIDSLKNT